MNVWASVILVLAAAIGGFYIGKDRCAATVTAKQQKFFSTLAEDAESASRRLERANAVAIPPEDVGCAYDAGDIEFLHGLLLEYQTPAPSAATGRN